MLKAIKVEAGIKYNWEGECYSYVGDKKKRYTFEDATVIIIIIVIACYWYTHAKKILSQTYTKQLLKIKMS